jgi:hypothetical protein
VGGGKFYTNLNNLGLSGRRRMGTEEDLVRLVQGLLAQHRVQH